MRTLIPPALLIVVATAAWGQVDVVPRVGLSFEHFGETFRLSDDQDTVATINDYGSLLGLTVKSPILGENRFRVDTDVLLGKETRRFRLDFDGRARFGDNVFQLEHDGLYRLFKEGGDYSVTSDYLQEYVRVSWERRLNETVRLRVRDTIDFTWYESPNEYNLNSLIHRPGADVRFRVGELSEIRTGYQIGKRSVPDSTSLDYVRHTADLSVNLLIGWSASLDVFEQVERREYAASSVRESSWENRLDARFEFSAGERATIRILHENELVRFDEPDDLDFDFDWSRTGFQVEMHQSMQLDLSLMPLYSFLASSTAPEEEFTETGVEFGADWRIGLGTWVNFAYEIGRRDYEIGTSASDDFFDFDTTGPGDATGDPLFDTSFSDYIYHRLTLLVTSDVTSGISVNLFANWQPEDHRVNRHDTDTRIVSGGVEYRF